MADTSANLWLSWSHFAANKGELGFVPSSRSLGHRLSLKGFTPITSKLGVKGRGMQGIKVRDTFEVSQNIGFSE